MRKRKKYSLIYQNYETKCNKCHPHKKVTKSKMDGLKKDVEANIYGIEAKIQTVSLMATCWRHGIRAIWLSNLYAKRGERLAHLSQKHRVVWRENCADLTVTLVHKLAFWHGISSSSFVFKALLRMEPQTCGSLMATSFAMTAIGILPPDLLRMFLYLLLRGSFMPPPFGCCYSFPTLRKCMVM